MSKISLKVLEQRAAAVESCVRDIEFSANDNQSDEVDELRNNWDWFYTMFLDLHENIQDFIGEVEE